MTPEDFQDLLAHLRQHRAESPRLEVKLAQGGLPKRLWETLSAFSNTAGGGVLVLGLDEDRGFAPAESLDVGKLQADLASLCGQMVPPLRLLIETFQVEGRSVLVAEVPELSNDQKPCYYAGSGLAGGAFLRVGDGDRRLTPYEIQSLLESRGQPRHDLDPLAGTTIADLSAELLDRFLKRVRRRSEARFRSWSDERILQAFHVVAPQEGGDLAVTVAGWLCFAEYPQERFPNLCVTFLRFPTSTAGEPGPGGERFLDNVRLEGPVPDLVVGALGVVKRHMKRRGIVHGLYREDLWEYPEEVFREAIVNALGHRDLSPAARGAQVQVLMFPDRLEVVSPGGLFGPVSLDELGTVGVQSSRNQALMRLLEDLEPEGLPGTLCENRGTGLSSMLESLRRAGMSPPEFDVSLTRFRLAFPNHTMFDPERAAEPRPRSKRSPERGQEILSLLAREGPLSTLELAERLELSRAVIGFWLRKLRASGDVVPTVDNVRSPDVRYRLRST